MWCLVTDFANRIERHQIEHLAQEDDSESVKEIKVRYL